MAEHRVARRFFVTGIVQGVGYRFFAQRAAERLGIAGYAKNLWDGRVEVYAMGTEAILDELRTDLQRRPQAASVSSVKEEYATTDPRFDREFSIEYGA